jgi:hypothetical protein
VVVLSDALTHIIISFAHPDWMPAADHHDPQRAAAVRKTLLDKLATDRERGIGFHLPSLESALLSAADHLTALFPRSPCQQGPAGGAHQLQPPPTANPEA